MLNIKYFIIVFVILVSCDNSHHVLPNSIIPSEVEKIKIESIKDGIKKVRVVSKKEEISFLYDFFYKHEKKIDGLAFYAVFYKITFYSQRGINVFSFNNGNGIIYDDLDNNTYYYLNADNGSVVINKFF
jgi:hypothetical protein